MAKNDPFEISGLFDDLPDQVPQEQIAKIAFRNWRAHLVSIRALDKQVEKLLDQAVKQVLLQGKKLTAADIGHIFQRYPELRAALDKAMEKLNVDLTATIEQGSKEAWLRANTAGDEVVAAMAANNAQLAALLSSQQNKPQNDRALRAFQQREMQGMKLSDRVWSSTKGMKLDMERAIEVALAEGVPAQKLSQRVRELLKEPHRLYRRVRDKKTGELKLSHAAQQYHPGTGVYRSSYKNAMRIARTEVNMAYQASDSERWARSWWVKGIRVSLSNNHTCLDGKGKPAPLIDICDELAGDYPADFKFTGWHPQCRCYATAITCEYSDIRDYFRRERAGEDMTGYTPPGTITEPPSQFKRWLTDNSDRLARAAQRGTTPYFIANNAKYTDPNWKPGKTTATTTTTSASTPRKKTPLVIADNRHAKRELKDIEVLQAKWDLRKERYAEAERLRKDGNYYDIAVNPNGYGLKATHIGHNFAKDKGWYEKAVQETGYNNGESVILKYEDHTKHKIKNTEGTWNGKIMEIAAAENGESQNIRNALKHCAKKPNTETAVVFSLNELPEAQILEGLARYNGLKGTTQWKQFAEIVFIFKSGKIKKYRPK